jgi:hypothetical protein
LVATLLGLEVHESFRDDESDVSSALTTTSKSQLSKDVESDFTWLIGLLVRLTTVVFPDDSCEKVRELIQYFLDTGLQ